MSDCDFDIGCCCECICACCECLSLFCAADDGCCCGGGDTCSENQSYRCLCCCLLILLAVVALVLILAFAVVHPVHMTVQDATLARLALSGPNGTALAYDVSLAIAVRNPSWAMSAVPGANAPFDAELLFSGVPFAHVRLLQGSSRGIKPGKKEVYHVAAAGESVQLGSSELAEFVKESNAGGVFRLELKLAGDVRYPPNRHVKRVNVTCPLELPLSSATAAARFTEVKCV